MQNHIEALPSRILTQLHLIRKKKHYFLLWLKTLPLKSQKQFSYFLADLNSLITANPESAEFGQRLELY